MEGISGIVLQKNHAGKHSCMTSTNSCSADQILIGREPWWSGFGSHHCGQTQGEGQPKLGVAAANLCDNLDDQHFLIPENSLLWCPLFFALLLHWHMHQCAMTVKDYFFRNYFALWSKVHFNSSLLVITYF